MLPEKQFQCAICQQVFTDPVTTPCGHNFCRACIWSVWDGSEVCRCPACSTPFTSRPEMAINAAFKELADAFRQMAARPAAPRPSPGRPGEVACDVCAATSQRVKALKSCLVCLTSYCEAHLEPHRSVATLNVHKLMEPAGDLQDRMCKKHQRLLEMFCRDEQRCVCQFCTETEHKGHRAVTVEDESGQRKIQMEKTAADFQQMIQERLKKVEEIKSCLKLSNTSAEKETKESDRLFASLVRSVEERRAEAQAEIEEKQRAAERRAEELVHGLQQEITELQRRSAELEELRDTEDHLSVLQKSPPLMSAPPTREWTEIAVNPELCVGTLRGALSKLDASLKNELDGLKTGEMKKMQKYAVDIALDPETAHPNIVLSADGKQAGRGELLRVVPDNPQRFDPVICVLAKRGFLSGRFYFQVAVGTKTFWDLGVVKASVNRKGMIISKPENGFWTVRLRGGEEYRALDSPSVLLALQAKPRLVGVFTDIEEGTVSFFDVEARSHLYTFSGCMFSERIFPFFCPGVFDDGKNTAPLVISDTMERRLFCILVLSGLFPRRNASSLQNRRFVFVDEPKSWDGARRHCREQHTDLATVNDQVDLVKLSGLIERQVPRAFLGLYRAWGWSLTDDDDYREGEQAYWNWGKGEDLKKDVHCGSIGAAGEWFATNCTVGLNVSCYDGSQTAPSDRFSLGQGAMSWRDAQTYCRGRHTDLARVRSAAENKWLRSMAPGGPLWIGLSGTGWAWSDGTQPSFTPWRPQRPSADAPGGCAALVLDSEPLAMEDGDCAEELPFFCYDDPMRKALLRLKLSADSYVDMRAPAVMDSIVKWVEKKLSDEGVTVDVKISWWKLPEKEAKPEEEQTEPMELCVP